MKIFWDSQKLPVSQQELDKFEDERGVQIPQSYRDFIVQNRGGYSAGGNDVLFAPSWNETPVSIWYGASGSRFGGTFHKREFGNFSWAVSEKFIQFAEDPGGQVFVMDLRPKTYGKVYVRDHDGPLARPPVIDDAGFASSGDHEEAELYHLIADSFDAFLGLLGPDPDGP